MMLMQRDPPVDWKAVLLELLRMGWSLAGIARAINVPTPTLRRWWDNGAQPMFEHGRALLKLRELAKKNALATPKREIS